MTTNRERAGTHPFPFNSNPHESLGGPSFATGKPGTDGTFSGNRIRGNSYSYDAWGNLLGKSITKCGAEHFSVTADTHNWIHASAPDYQYDAAGNMTFDATFGLNYTFDQENRISGAAGSSW